MLPFPVGLMMRSLPSLSLLLLSSLSQEPAGPIHLKNQQPQPPRTPQPHLSHQTLGPHRLKPKQTLLKATTNCISPEICQALDLPDILEKISLHCGTRRGRHAILAAAGFKETESRSPYRLSDYAKSQYASSRQRRVRDQDDIDFVRESPLEMRIAHTSEEAMKELEYVDEAMKVLMNQKEEKDSTMENLTIPDFYGADSGPYDVNSVAVTDDDEWLNLPVEEWTLQDILKADQIIQMLLRVYFWAQSLSTTMVTPLLAEIGSDINASALSNLCSDIQGSVVVKRAKTALDPSGRSSYQFCLSTEKFPALHLLYERKDDVERRTKAKRKTEKQSHELSALQEEIQEKEAQIRQGLIVSIAKHRVAIDRGLSLVGRLDMLFAKAAFSVANSCVIPVVKSCGVIHVDGFRHPLLEREVAVPVDLRLSVSDCQRALVISGPNGGGKTLAMKSFGVVTMFAKLGIPVPTYSKTTESPPRVDFFNRIHTSIGDHQSVSDGQSTFMGQLSRLSEFIAHTSKPTSDSDMFLLDEIGRGTDQNAGAAIIQAILEKLLSNPGVRIVATTHCPRLKSFSFEDPNVTSASVLLAQALGKETTTPTYRLMYGIIGESQPLAAASRCHPKLPEDVFERATALMNADNEDATYLRTLGDSMRHQLELARAARLEAEDRLSTNLRIQSALARLALSYERHFGQLEQRLDQYYENIKQNPDTLELVGDVLSEVRTVKKTAQSDIEFLRNKGLRPVPHDYDFSDGELVTIIANGEWNGEMAKVCLAECLNSGFKPGSDDVAVQPYLQWDHSIHDEQTKFMVFKKTQLAIWDYEGTASMEDDSVRTVTSVPDSKRKLGRVLAALETVNNEDDSSKRSFVKYNESEGGFKSAMERKAARVKKKRKD